MMISKRVGRKKSLLWDSFIVGFLVLGKITKSIVAFRYRGFIDIF
jgi:hypothetical protein